MTIFQSIVLGIVQGLTEFIPISSSGHLVIIRALLNWPEPSILFDVVLHGGTLLALLIYFRRDLIKYFRPEKRKFLLILLFSAVPAAIAAPFLKNFIDQNLQNLQLVTIFLLVTALALIISDRLKTKKERPAGDMTIKDSLLIGLAQALALIPGISRSGITIAAGRTRSMNRSQAARFSFLMAIPITLGIEIVSLYELFAENQINGQISSLVVGFIFSGVVGFLCIKFLLQYLRRHSLTVFSVYLVLLSLGLIIYQFVTG